MKIKLVLSALFLGAYSICAQEPKVYHAADYGLRPGSTKNASKAWGKMWETIRSEHQSGDSIVIRFQKGTYHFHEQGAAVREYYISNHDQTNPKKVGIALENINRMELDGGGAQFIFHGRMLPLSLLHSENCTLKNFSIDFANPHIAQVEIVENDPQRGVTFRPAPWVQWRISKDSVFEALGEGWTVRHGWGIAFEKETKRIAYNTGDRGCPTKGAYRTKGGLVHAPAWKDAKLKPGMVFVMRGTGRPTPGIFLSENVNTRLENIRVHYAEGMGLLAQLCENVTLDSFNVCLKGEEDPRYFTTQADATHFSGCKGTIVSQNGLYEGMMDDAINVHGTYLKVVRRIDDRTLIGRYMHGQSWGFRWGIPGDEVQFVKASTMETVGETNRIVSIQPCDTGRTEGAREFRIVFEQTVGPLVHEEEGFGMENLTRTPQVVFAGNTVRNNRARGALFSTPKRVLVENNLFDHTSGTAILLCGDCNGWYESGACRDVQIRGNRFVNALTSLYQFTNAVISIYPEIPELDKQQAYFHGGKEGGIVIEDNVFDTFDLPLLYAKSVDGLVFCRNEIRTNMEYPPFHPSGSRFLLEKVTNARIE